MRLAELLTELKSKDIHLNYINGKIKYSGSQNSITPEILQEMKLHKEALIKYLWSKEKTNLIPICISNHSKTPLVFVHGGNAVTFLTRMLNDDRSIFNYLDHGSDGEKIKYEDIDSMADAYLEQLLKLWPNGNFVLCGFSFGGLLAFKMAEMMQKRGKNQVPFVILLDTKTPQAEEMPKFQRLIKVKKNKFIFLYEAFVRKLKKFPVYYFYLMLNIEIPVQHRRLYISSVYNRLANHFVPTKIDSEILLFRSIQNKTIDTFMGWKDFASNVEIIELRGSHHGILQLDENFSIIYNKIISYLNKVENNE